MRKFSKTSVSDNVFKYWIEIADSKKSIGWKKSWSSEIFIEADDEMEESWEYLAYDLNDLVGSVGGYLGLFLGWSLLGLTIHTGFAFCVHLGIFNNLF